MRKASLVLAVVLALSAPALVLAHEGHAHQIMGTVTMVAPDRVMMKTTTGREITVAVNSQTKVLTGRIETKLEGVKTGTRIVATVSSDKAPCTASVIDVGTVVRADGKKK